MARVADARARVEEGLGVGVQRALHHVVRGALLHDLAAVHDRDAVGHVLCHVEVVGDEDHGEPQPPPEVL